MATRLPSTPRTQRTRPPGPARGGAGLLLLVTLVAAACGGGTSQPASIGDPAPAAESPAPVVPDSPANDESGEPPAQSPVPSDAVDLTTAGQLCPDTGDEWEVAKLYIEHNATDADTGVHGLFGGAAWQALCIWDPTGVQILAVEPTAQMAELTIADFFFESREPPNDEYSIADLRAAFPEGRYVVSGTDFEGKPRVGSAIFTHDIPAAPEITSPALAEDPETVVDEIVPTGDLVVRWAPVTETIDATSAMITGYEVIVTTEFFEDPNGLSRPVYDVHVGPDVTELVVPDGWLQPGTIYELEILALEVSGNQTISVGFFATA